MSRSCRHTPIAGITTAASDKRDKVLAHRAERVAVRCAPARGDDDAPGSKLFGDPCDADKDGEQFLSDPRPDLMRK